MAAWLRSASYSGRMSAWVFVQKGSAMPAVRCHPPANDAPSATPSTAKSRFSAEVPSPGKTKPLLSQPRPADRQDREQSRVTLAGVARGHAKSFASARISYY